MHVLKDERSKPEPKMRQYVFVDYVRDEFGYRVYDLVE